MMLQRRVEIEDELVKNELATDDEKKIVIEERLEKGRKE